MVPNGPKSAIFLDDVIGYPRRCTFSNLAKKMGLDKYDLEMVWFIEF